MDIRPAIRAALLLESDITDLVDSRIYPMLAPQGERGPLIVVTRVSENEEPVLKGPSGLLQSRVQIDCWGPTPDAASALAEAVRARLHGLSGEFLGVTISGAFAGTIREDQDRETHSFRVGRDYIIWARAAG